MVFRSGSTMDKLDKFRLAGEVDLYGKKRNPFVLVGAVATAGVLFAGITAFRRGNTVS